jgi:histidyl-tRNA synthetase
MVVTQLLSQIVVPQNAELDKWILGLCLTAIGILFYLLRDSYLARIADREASLKVYTELQNRIVDMQIKYLENQVKTAEILESLKKSLDASNDANEKLIIVLGNDQVTNLKQKIKDLEAGKAVTNKLNNE